MLQNTTYHAVLINTDNKDYHRHAGELEINDFQIRFTSESHNITFPLNQLQISIGGAGDQLIFFHHPSQPTFSLYSDNHSILKNPVLVQHPELLSQIKQVKQAKRKIIYSILLFVGIIAGITASLIFSKDFFVRKIAEQAPVEWEQKLGDKLFQGLSMQYVFIKNDSLKTRFTQVAKPLLDQIQKDGVKVDIYFTNDPTINAFALPGGKVVIQSGLIDRAESWEEVLGVLSHELAHVTQRHHLRGIINNIGLYAILSAYFGDISALAGTVINTGGQLASLANSRDFEYEADEVGLRYLVAAKINSNGLITFFETLKKAHKTELQMEKELSFLSTHPATDDRIENLKKLQKNYPAYAPIKFTESFPDFQQAIDNSIKNN